MRVRRYLIEHRFNAAQGALGMVALSVGLWLLWPAQTTSRVDHHGLWERSLQTTERSFAGREDAVHEGFESVPEASMAMSAKGEALGLSEPQVAEIAGARLVQIARTMPAIGVPDPGIPYAAAAGMQSANLALDGSDRGQPAAAELGATATALRGTSANSIVARLVPRAPTTSLALPAPPSRGLSATTPTWLSNAVAPPLLDGRPAIAVVIDDLGLSPRGTAALVGLKAPLTLSFLPYATGLEEQTQAARAAGHELMLHVPMQPTGHDWPGPNALLASLSPSELLSRFRVQLRSFRGFVGVNNHMGSLLTTDRAKMAEVMTELKSRGLLFLDSRTTSKTVAASEAERLGVPHAERDVFLDNDADLGAIRRQLTATERIARRRGVAVAIGHPHELTIEALRGWLPTLEERGFALVPISTVVARASCAHGLLVAASACGRYVSAHNAVDSAHNAAVVDQD